MIAYFPSFYGSFWTYTLCFNTLQYYVHLASSSITHILSSHYWSILSGHCLCCTKRLSDPFTNVLIPLSKFQCAFVSQDLHLGFLFQGLSVGSGAALPRRYMGGCLLE